LIGGARRRFRVGDDGAPIRKVGVGVGGVSMKSAAAAFDGAYGFVLSQTLSIT